MPLAWLLAAALDAATLLEGPLLPEGSAWNAPGAMVLEGPLAAPAMALGRAMLVRGLLVQADFDDTYFVEGSVDDESYRILWRVPALPAPPGLRTRFTILDNPVAVRFVRVRAASGPPGYSVARVRLFEAVPSPWPPALDLSLPERKAPLFPALTPIRVVTLRLVLGGVAFAVVLWRMLDRHDRRTRTALVGIAVLSLLAWTNFLNFHFRGLTHGWELYHYYAGAKYAPELGYDGLYECTALADAEDAVDLGPKRPFRDLRTDRAGSIADAPARPACRGRFDADRWQAFRDDIRFFRGFLGDDWARILSDHGHNASPLWNLVGGAVARIVPATAAGMTLLASLDFVVLLLLAVVLTRAFGVESACVAALFFGLNALSRFAWTGGSFLRYDWLALVLGGIGALRTGRPRLAGFALAWATLLRVFPGVVIAGVVWQAVLVAVLEGPGTAWRRLRPFAAGVALALATLVPASALLVGGEAGWSAFAANSRKYLGTEAENKLGLSTALAFRPGSSVARLHDPMKADPYEDWGRAQTESVRQTRPLRVVLVVAFLGLLAMAVVGKEPWVAAVLGAGLLPVLFQQANYYYVLLTAFALLFSGAPGVGLGLLALAWSSEAAAQIWPALDVRAAVLSGLACVYVFWATWSMARSRVSP